jgi:hypothetical protein
VTAITLNGKLLAISEVKGDRVLLRRLPKEEIATMYGSLHLPQSSVELGVDCQTIRGYVYPGMRVICPRWKRKYLDEDGDYWLTGEDELLAVIGD